MSVIRRAILVTRSHWNHEPFRLQWLALRPLLPVFVSIINVGHQTRTHTARGYTCAVAGLIVGAIAARLLFEFGQVRAGFILYPGNEA